MFFKQFLIEERMQLLYFHTIDVQAGIEIVIGTELHKTFVSILPGYAFPVIEENSGTNIYSPACRKNIAALSEDGEVRTY